MPVDFVLITREEYDCILERLDDLESEHGALDARVEAIEEGDNDEPDTEVTGG